MSSSGKRGRTAVSLFAGSCACGRLVSFFLPFLYGTPSHEVSCTTYSRSGKDSLYPNPLLLCLFSGGSACGGNPPVVVVVVVFARPKLRSTSAGRLCEAFAFHVLDL